MSRLEWSFIALWGSHVPKATLTEPHLVHTVWQEKERGREIVCERLVGTEAREPPKSFGD